MGFLARLVMTLVIEIGLALFFGYRSKGQLLLIGLTNVVTQILLNLGLYFGYQQVDRIFYLYLFLELLIMAAEGLVYTFFLTKERSWRSVRYAFFANALSYGMGLLIAASVPKMF